MKKIILAVLTLPLLLSAADIYMAGDSTMCLRKEKEFPLYGWGMPLEKMTIDGVKIHNRAFGGRSSKSFITEKRWEKITNEIKPGDFVIVQFGINDAARGDKNFYRHTDPENTYRNYLRIYIAEARAKGAIPVICTQTMFCSFDKNGKVYRSKTVEKYVEACHAVAKETGCDLIDLNTYALEKFAKLGKDASLEYYMFFAPGKYPNYPDGRKDTCHLRVSGAEFYAKAFVELAKKQNLPIAKIFK
jgi:lysophospholipase L1-like esterase